MFNTQFILLFTTLLELQGILGQSSQCESNPNIGTNDETPYDRSTTAGLYLNLNSSAECNGTISSYRYCYYQPVVASRHVAVIAVYRLMGDVYEHVVGTEHNFDLDLSSLTTPTDPLVCNNLAIAPVQLQTGDVVGACVFETMMPNRAQLDLVGQSAIGSTLYSASNSGCIRNNPPPNVSVQDLSSPLTSTILHLSAIITPTTDPSPTTVETTGSPTNTPSTSNSTSDRAGAPGVIGGVVAGVIVVLIMVVIAVTVVMVIVLLMKRKEGNMMSRTSSVDLDTNVAYGTHIETSNEPGHGFLHMSTNEAYVVSDDVGQTENNEYCTIPEQTDNEYAYVDNNL